MRVLAEWEECILLEVLRMMRGGRGDDGEAGFGLLVMMVVSTSVR